METITTTKTTVTMTETTKKRQIFSSHDPARKEPCRGRASFASQKTSAAPNKRVCGRFPPNQAVVVLREQEAKEGKEQGEEEQQEVEKEEEK